MATHMEQLQARLDAIMSRGQPYTAKLCKNEGGIPLIVLRRINGFKLGTQPAEEWLAAMERNG